MNHISEPILLNTAVELADKTSELIRAQWHQPRQVKLKGFRDLVTDTDTAVQKIVTDAIRAKFPDHGFLTEEADSNLPTGGPIIWVIDPVDGTTNFSRSVPTFCVSIAAVSHTNEPLAGVVYDLMRQELFGAARGQGAWLRDRSGEQRPLAVSPVESLGEVLFALDWSRQPGLRQTASAVLDVISPRVQSIRAIGAAALALCWLAAGRFDGYINMELSPWDLAAAGLIIGEAGGQISHLDGQPWRYSTQSGGIVASNGRLHQPLLDHILPITKQGN